MFKDDHALLCEILDAMITCDGKISRVCDQVHINKSTVFRYIAQSEISPDSNKLEWGENGLKPFHVHAKLARRMGRLISHRDYFDDEAPPTPPPFKDEAEEVDDATRIARARADVARGPQMHPEHVTVSLDLHQQRLLATAETDERKRQQASDRLNNDPKFAEAFRRGGELHRERVAREIAAENEQRIAREEVIRKEAVAAAMNGDDGDLTEIPAPASTGDARTDALNRLLAKIEARGDGPTANEADAVARLQIAPVPRGRPPVVMVGKPEDEPAPPVAVTGDRKPWSPKPAPAIRPLPTKDGEPNVRHDSEGLGVGHVRPGGVRVQ